MMIRALCVMAVCFGLMFGTACGGADEPADAPTGTTQPAGPPVEN
jgi:hypothetical protein